MIAPDDLLLLIVSWLYWCLDIWSTKSIISPSTYE